MFSTTEGIGYVSADGSRVGPLLRVNAADGGDWSPDGDQIAYTATGTDGAGDLWIADFDGRHAQQELDCQTCSARYVDWSPDGTRLVYTFQESEASPYELRVRTLTTGAESVISFPPGQEIRAPQWSPDSTTIALVVDLGVTDRVATVNPAAGLSSLGYVSPASAGAQRPTWSPDGSQLVFSAGTPGPVAQTEATNDVYVVGADGTGLRQVTHSDPGVRVFGAEWEPDGLRFLASLADGTQPAHLVRVSVDGAEIVPVTGPDGAPVLGIHAALRY
jgi:Tol biopolymer transport system component